MYLLLQKLDRVVKLMFFSELSANSEKQYRNFQN